MRRAKTALILVALALALVLVIFIGLRWLSSRQYGGWGGLPIVGDRCTAVADQYSGSMTPEQAGNAAIIVGEAIRRGLPPRAATIALVAAWQESGLRNLDYGDRDSLGLFQQRPSQGWGSEEEIMNPWYASGKFYKTLVKVHDWQSQDINDAAQAVQRSGFPNAYAKHESKGRAWASNLTGQTQAGVRCVANDGDGGGGEELVKLLNKVWKKKLPIDQTDSVIKVTTPNPSTAWSVAQLSMIQLAAYGMTSIQVGQSYWQHSSSTMAQWVTIDPNSSGIGDDSPDPNLSDSQVIVRLR